MGRQLLTSKQQAFVSHFVSGLNGTEAAMRAYNVKNRNTAAVIASENLRKPKISQTLGGILEENGITLEKALVPVAEALRATKRGANGLETPDHAVRLAASADALRLLSVTYGIDLRKGA